MKNVLPQAAVMPSRAPVASRFVRRTVTRAAP
jgi:hypothetical protein